MLELERPHLVLGRFDAEAEHQLQVRVGGQRLARGAVDRADVDTFVDGLEQPGERFGGRLRARHKVTGADEASAYSSGTPPCTSDRSRAGCRRRARQTRASAARSRATSMQIPQPIPCGLHSGLPLAFRRATKQSSLLPCPLRSQPQKHGMCFRTSGCRAANSYAARVIGAGRAEANCTTGRGGSAPSYPGRTLLDAVLAPAPAAGGGDRRAATGSNHQREQGRDRETRGRALELMSRMAR